MQLNKVTFTYNTTRYKGLYHTHVDQAGLLTLYVHLVAEFCRFSREREGITNSC